MKMVAVAAISLATSISLSAQWLNHPTPGVPRKADGSPDLAAPTPRTADGKPDFSGIWLLEKNNPCPPEGCPDMEISREFVNLGWNMPGGLPLQPWAAALRKARLAENSKDDPGSNCRPTGIVKWTINPFFRKFLQLPGLMVILNERDSAYRQIFTDGRSLPVDPAPTPNGYSVGRWDGDTLVVETTNFNPGESLRPYFDNSILLSPAAKVTERFTRVSAKQILYQFSVDDPATYSQVWHAEMPLNATQGPVYEYACHEGNYALPGMLGGARRQEKEAASKGAATPGGGE